MPGNRDRRACNGFRHPLIGEPSATRQDVHRECTGRRPATTPQASRRPSTRHAASTRPGGGTGADGDLADRHLDPVPRSVTPHQDVIDTVTAERSTTNSSVPSPTPGHIRPRQESSSGRLGPDSNARHGLAIHLSRTATPPTTNACSMRDQVRRRREDRRRAASDPSPSR